MLSKASWMEISQSATSKRIAVPGIAHPANQSILDRVILALYQFALDPLAECRAGGRIGMRGENSSIATSTFGRYPRRRAIAGTHATPRTAATDIKRLLPLRTHTGISGPRSLMSRTGQ